jgi:hypothetical protein
MTEHDRDSCMPAVKKTDHWQFSFGSNGCGFESNGKRLAARRGRLIYRIKYQYTPYLAIYGGIVFKQDIGLLQPEIINLSIFSATYTLNWVKSS